MSSRLLEIQTRIYNLLASWLPESDASGAEPAAPAQTILENQNRMYDLLAARFAQMPDEIADAVLQYLEDHPEALNQAAVEAILAGRLDGIEEDVGGLKSAIEDLEAGSLSALGATAGQVPVADGNGSWAWGNAAGGGAMILGPEEIQRLVADGKAKSTFNIGDVIYIPWTNYTPSTPVLYQFPFVVVHIGDAYD